MRDYTDMLNMPPAELAAHALECAKVGIISIALVEALAVQLKDTDELCEKLHHENAGLQVDLDEALDARDEWQGLAEQRATTHGKAIWIAPMGALLHWQANVAGLDDVDLLRFLAAVKVRLDNHAAALEAAAQEARRRNLLPKEKDGTKVPPKSAVGTKTGATVTESVTDGKRI